MEAVAARLCLHSPAVVGSGLIGKTIGRTGAICDPFGDALVCCKDLVGDTWRQLAMGRECMSSHLPYDIEVYGIFSHLMPAVAVQEGGELQYARARQGLVPDFRLRLPTPQGPTDCLAELKVIGAGVT